MLITTDPGWENPQWPGGLVRVALPRHRADGADMAAWRKTSTVFEFTRDARAVTILREVLDRRDRYNQFEPRRFLFAAERMGRDSLAALAQKAADDPWLIDYKADPMTGDLLMLHLGKNVTSNPLFVHFFRNLTNTDELDAEPVVQALRQYCGRPGSAGGPAT